MQQEQSSPHQQGNFTPGVMRFTGAEVVEVAEEEEVEGVERAVVVGLVVRTCLGILCKLLVGLVLSRSVV